LSFIVGLFSDVSSAFSQAFSTVEGFSSSIGSSISQGLDAIGSSASNLFKDIASIPQAIVSALYTFGSWIWKGLYDIGKAFGTAIATAFDLLKRGIETFGSWIYQGLSFIWQGMIAIGQWFWSALVTLAKYIWNALKTVYQTIVDWVSHIADTISSWFNTIASDIDKWLYGVACNLRNKLSTMIFTDITIWGLGKSLENMFEGKMGIKDGIARALTAPIFASFAAVLFDSIVPGCTQKTQSFVLAPRSVSISLPVEEFQEPELITGTTGFAQFTLPYGLELIPTLSYVYNILGQPAYPESYGTTVSPSLTLTTEVLGQPVYPESTSLTLTPSFNLTYEVTGQPVGPESFSLAMSPKLTYTYNVTGNPSIILKLTPSLTYVIEGPITLLVNKSLQPRLILDSPGTFILTETVSGTPGTPSTTSVSDSASGSVGQASTTSVSETVYGSAGTSPATPTSTSLTLSPQLTYTTYIIASSPFNLTASPKLTYTYSVS